MNSMEEKTLIEALDLLEQGLSVDEIVARYPATADDLRPFLQTAAALATLAAQPTVAAQTRSRANFLAAAEASRHSSPTFGRLTRRLVMPLLAVFFAVFMGGALLTGASGSAVPGSALYAVKRGAEEVRLSLAPDPERAAALREAFRQERIREIESLLASGDLAQVDMSGAIEAMAGDLWRVAGLPVTLTGGTFIDGMPAVGAVVRVEGRTSVEVVIADRITVLSAAPAPGPTVTPVPDPTTGDADRKTPAAPTDQPEATQTPSPMITPSAASHHTPAAPSPNPGVNATPDDNDNDDDRDDDVDDNDDDDVDDNDDDSHDDDDSEDLDDDNHRR